MDDTSDAFGFGADEAGTFDYRFADAVNDTLGDGFDLYTDEFESSGNAFLDTPSRKNLASGGAAGNRDSQHRSVTQSFDGEPQQIDSSRTLSSYEGQSRSRTPFMNTQGHQSQHNLDDVCESWLLHSHQPSASLAQTEHPTGVPQTPPPSSISLNAQMTALAPAPPGLKRKESARPGDSPLRPPKRRRRQKSPARAAKKKVRQVGGACIRCKMYHETVINHPRPIACLLSELLKCTEHTPCDRCHAIANSAIFFQPCTRDELTKIMPFRSGEVI